MLIRSKAPVPLFMLLSVVLLGSSSCATGAGRLMSREGPAAEAIRSDRLRLPVTIHVRDLASSDGACQVEEGEGESILLRGVVLTRGVVYGGGEVLIDAEGEISCVGGDCSGAPEAASATWITCSEAVISPGFINPHDHIDWSQQPPAGHGSERFDQRHDWRRGQRGFTMIPAEPNRDPKVVAWTELRQVMAGTTSISSSGGVEGLLRNFNGSQDLQEGLSPVSVVNDVFPLGDPAGLQLEGSCSYPDVVGPSDLNVDAYVAHVAEGVDAVAHNEFLCLSGQAEGGVDIVLPRSTFTHAIALTPADAALVERLSSSLVWSPRSNFSLYGATAPVTMYRHVGIDTIALGTDWTPSGSMNMLRELQCAESFNRDYLDGFFSSFELWEMATFNAAVAVAAENQIGALECGYFADVAIFDGRDGGSPFQTILSAGAEEVLLVLRGGEPLYGDAELMAALGRGDEGCEEIPGGVCGRRKIACVERETGSSFEELRLANEASYPLFFCGTPENEPSCIPRRPPDRWGCGEYPLPEAEPDRDRDGVEDTRDNCPTIFNPVLPLQGSRAETPRKCAQADHDGDGLGDACDPDPLVH